MSHEESGCSASADAIPEPTVAAIRVAVLNGFFVPGFLGGGPIRSIDAITRCLGGRFRFYVWTQDRDLGDRKPYAEVIPGTWIQSQGRLICYVDAGRLRGYLTGLRQLRSVEPDLYYFNSLWCVRFTVLPLLLLWLGWLPRRPMIIAPRGQFFPAALSISPLRKRIVGAVLRRTVLRMPQLTWHATSQAEEESIRRWAGRAQVATVPVIAVPELALPPRVDADAVRDREVSESYQRTAGALRVLFLSRLAPIKNLDGALVALFQTSAQIHFRIVGPPEDEAFVRRCRSLAERLPANVDAEFVGPTAHDRIGAEFSWADIFFLPTKSENFGHVIREALSYGCPVLTSTATPWTAVLEDAGLHPLDSADSAGFAAELDRLAALSSDAMVELHGAANAAYQRWAKRQRRSEGAMARMLLSASSSNLLGSPWRFIGVESTDH